MSANRGDSSSYPIERRHVAALLRALAAAEPDRERARQLRARSVTINWVGRWERRPHGRATGRNLR